MDAAAPEPFGALLRRCRLIAGLTQEALAERAGLGVRSVQALERGENHPQRDTAERLATALDVDAVVHAQFLDAATPVPRHRSDPVPEPAASPAVTPEQARTNLPIALTSFVGRAEEIATLTGLLARTRLLTLTGSGGVGKTRLALTLAGGLAERYPDGVWLVELAPLAEPGLVPGAVAQALGVREEAGRPLTATLADQLQGKQLLLVLDNCEHLVEACARLAGTLLRACSHLRILATSREALGVAGEVLYRVPSLPVPDLAHLPPPERLAESAAVALFLARAQERRPDFVATAQNARAVAAVCARLDGIPLAIELAAARVGSLSVESIAARLDDRFRLLTGGARDALPRQRTLRAALDWSYDLLTASEQLLLDRLSVFAGSSTLAATEAVCAGDGVERWEILDLLDRLVNKSLVLAEEAGGDLRYGLLETVRQYGEGQLAAAGGAAAQRDRHLAWYLALAEEAAPHLSGTEQVAWLDRLEVEHDNLRAALRWARECGATVEGLRLAGALWAFWGTRCYLGEGRGWLEGALAGGTGGGAARARALRAAGDLAAWLGDFGRGAALLEESLALYRALGDTRSIADVLNQLGAAVERQNDYGRAVALQEESLALSRALEHPEGIGFSLSELGRIAWVRGEYRRAVACYEESLARFREMRSREGVAYALSNLACVLERCGAYEQAASLQEESLALWRDGRNPAGTAWSLVNLGWTLLALGEEDRATVLLEESLAVVRETGHYWGIPRSLMCLGWAAYLRGEHERAAALQEQALALFRQVNYGWDVTESLVGLGCVLQPRGEYRRAAASLREALVLGREIGARGRLAEALECLAWLVVAQGQAERAARLGGAAEALREALGAPLHAVLRVGHEQAVQAMHAALGEEAFAAGWTAGRARPFEESVALALEGHAEPV